MRILFWAPFGANEASGGQGVYTYRLANALRTRLGATADLAHGDPGQAITGAFGREVLIHPIGRRRRTFEQLLFVIRGVLWILRNARRYDVIVGIDTFETTITPLRVAKYLGARIVVRQASQKAGLSPTRGWKRLFNRPAARARICARFDCMVAISSAIRADLLALGIDERNISVIYNGVDTHRFREPTVTERAAVRKKLGFRDDEIVVLTVASLMPRKRIEWAIHAIGLMAASGVPARLLVVGGEHAKHPGYLESLRKLARERGVEKRCLFHDSTPRIEELYRAADLFCLCSSYEGMPNVLLEAGATGLACCATPVSGVGDIIEDGRSGFVVESAEDLAARMTELAVDMQMRRELGQRAAARIREQFDIEQVASRYLQAFGGEA